MSTEVAIVTGGAGDIGRTICRKLAEKGYSIVIADVDPAKAELVVSQLPGEQPHRTISGDLVSTDVNRAAVAAAIELGELTVLVNAVGISPKNNGAKIEFYDVTDALWDQVMAVNLKAPFILIREAYSHMPTDGRSSIVNILSITAKLGTGGLPNDKFQPVLPSTVPYAVSKAGLQNLTACMARSLASFNIRVNGVSPGLVAGSMSRNAPDRDNLARQVPLGRFGTTEEMADGVVFLTSKEASYINGASLDINGGWFTC